MFRARQPSATARGPLALLARGRPTSAGPPAEGTRARAGPGLLVRPPATPRGRGARAPCGGKCPAAGRAAIFPRTARAKNNNNGARSEMRAQPTLRTHHHGGNARRQRPNAKPHRMHMPHACVLISPHSLPPLTCEVIGVRGTRIFDTRARPRGVDRRTGGRERASGPSTRRRCLGAGASPRTITVPPQRGLRPAGRAVSALRTPHGSSSGRGGVERGAWRPPLPPGAGAECEERFPRPATGRGDLRADCRPDGKWWRVL